MTQPIYPCPVCGYFTFVEPPGSYDVCAVCGWEDDALQLEFATSLSGGANPHTLAETQERFLRAEARMARRHEGSRVPRVRDADWRPIDPLRDRFPEWQNEAGERSPLDPGEALYYWRETFWNRRPAS